MIEKKLNGADQNGFHAVGKQMMRFYKCSEIVAVGNLNFTGGNDKY